MQFYKWLLSFIHLLEMYWTDYRIWPMKLHTYSCPSFLLIVHLLWGNVICVSPPILNWLHVCNCLWVLAEYSSMNVSVDILEYDGLRPFFQERSIKILLKLTGNRDAVILKATQKLNLAQVVPNIPPTVIPCCSDYTKGEMRRACRCKTIPLDRRQVMLAQRGAVGALCQKTCWCFYFLVWFTIICLYSLSPGQIYGG